MIRNVLAEIWLAKPETARRVRQRIGTVLDWAYASGYRETEAPMRAITKGLPRQPKKEGHFAAMPYAKVPTFLPRLRERESFSRLALEFAIFTASRSGEVRGATWEEIDLEAKLWTIPKDRMKANREHVVPLTAPAIRIIERCAQLRIRDCPLGFPGLGERGDRPSRGCRRSGTGTHGEGQDRGRLSARQSSGETPDAHGRLGQVVRQGEMTMAISTPVHASLGNGPSLTSAPVSWNDVVWDIFAIPERRA